MAVGIPSLILRRRYPVYCPWNAIDGADKMIVESRWGHLVQCLGPKITAVVGMAGVLFGYPELSPPLPDLPRPMFLGGGRVRRWGDAGVVGSGSGGASSEHGAEV